ncbi:MAG: N-acetylneuraminate synthase, partial [Candidatus Levybacteria bacterium CG10_big_fil_rev_8_21_14_0_10_35_13]
HLASAEPDELQAKIKAIKDVKIILGKSKKWPNISELRNMVMTVRKSIVANHSLEKGQILTEEDIEAKRPGNGVSPTLFKKFIGKRLKRNVLEDEQISLRDII